MAWPRCPGSELETSSCSLRSHSPRYFIDFRIAVFSNLCNIPLIVTIPQVLALPLLLCCNQEGCSSKALQQLVRILGPAVYEEAQPFRQMCTEKQVFVI